MRRAAAVGLVALLAACGGGGDKAASTTTTTTSTTSTTSTTLPTVPSDFTIDNAGVTLHITKFRFETRANDQCDRELSGSPDARCFVVDFTVAAAPDLAADEGGVTFDSYVVDGHQFDNVFFSSVRPGATKTYSVRFGTQKSGGKLFGSIGILNKDMHDFTVDVPQF